MVWFSCSIGVEDRAGSGHLMDHTYLQGFAEQSCILGTQIAVAQINVCQCGVLLECTALGIRELVVQHQESSGKGLL